MNDYYYLLGVKQSASSAEIKLAYRKLSLKFHPDVNTGDAFFTERFKAIQEAYEILSDDSKRKSYDKQVLINSLNYENPSSNLNNEVQALRDTVAGYKVFLFLIIIAMILMFSY